jgi:hypothetical protein
MDRKLTIITPCCRPVNLPKLYESINFDSVDKWIIVYDTSKDRSYNRIFTDHPKIIETECDDVGSAGHPQRNFGLNFVSKGFIYFLDDDNIMHPNFWTVYPGIMNDNRCMYSFDLENEDGSIKKGDQLFLHVIDTAMVLIHHSIIKGLKWYKHFVYSDGIFITTLYEKNKDVFAYIPTTLCYHNKLV